MLYIRDNVLLMACHVAKFHGVTPPNPKVIGANTLNYKPIFDPPLKKIVEGAPSPVGCRVARLKHSIVRVKILGAAPLKGQSMVFRKSRFWRAIAPLNLSG